MNYRLLLSLGLPLLVLMLGAAAARSQPAGQRGAETDLVMSASRSARWADATPLQDGLPRRLGDSLRLQDVLAYATPGVLYPARNIGLQCQGVNATLADVPRRAAHVNTTGGTSEARFGEADVSGSRAFRLQASAQDVLPAGTSPRCELVFYPMPGSALPQAQTFWLAFSFWAGDWAGTQDEQLIAQLHVQEPRNILLNPFFALVVRGGEMRVEIRHNILERPSQATTQLVTAARMPMLARQWVTAVVQARISSRDEHAPFLRLWLNDRLAADYAGPLGYVLPQGGYPYAKVGVYHWAAGNPWDLKVPERAMLVGAMLAVNDATGRYTPDQIRAAVSRPDLR